MTSLLYTWTLITLQLVTCFGPLPIQHLANQAIMMRSQAAHIIVCCFLPSAAAFGEVLQVALGANATHLNRWCPNQQGKYTVLKKQHREGQTCLVGRQWGWARSR